MVSHYRSHESRRRIAPAHAAHAPSFTSLGRLGRILPLMALGSGLMLGTTVPARAQDPVYPPAPAAPQSNPAPAPGEPALPPPAAGTPDAQYPPAPAQAPAGDQNPAAGAPGEQYPPAPAQPPAGDQNPPAGAQGNQYPPAAAPGPGAPPQAYEAPAPGDQDGQNPPPAAAGPQYANGIPGAPAATAAQSGPVRMVRFSMISGDVSWRPGDNSAWQTATDNLPLDQGAEIAVSDQGRAELQFDDGSFLRLGQGSSVALVTLYSDAQGEFTEIHVDRGISTLHLTNHYSIYQVDTVNAQVKAAGPATVRVGVGNVTDVAVRAGQAQVQGAAGSVTLNSGNYLAVAAGDTAYNVQALPEEDSWDAFNDERDSDIVAAAAAVPEGALPPDIALAAPDLSTYGTWATVPQYGQVWYPRARPGWRPYYNGRWTYFAPYGWTWVSSEPWGWAPYHYGTWIDTANGWAWVPGPASQYWSPAVVHFSTDDDTVAWCPLAPEEVVYPDAFAVGDYGNSWSLFFSIGGCGVFLADGGGICHPYPWSWGYLHGRDWGPGFADRGGLTPAGIERHEFGAGIVGGTLVDHPFVPRNQRFGAAVVVGVGDFENHGAYRVGGTAATAIFATGHATVLSAGRPFAGPVSIRPAAALGAARGTFGVSPAGHANVFTSSSDPSGAARAARNGLFGNTGMVNAGGIPRTGYSTTSPSFYDRYAPSTTPHVQGSLYGGGYTSHTYGGASYPYSGGTTARTGPVEGTSHGYANSTGGFSRSGESTGGFSHSAGPIGGSTGGSNVGSSASVPPVNSGGNNNNNQGNPNHGH